jgi:transcriptional regulator with XRE-family HTH domain
VVNSRTQFAEVFDQLVRESGLSAAEIARRLDVYSGQVSHWRRGGPGGGISLSNVHKIADLFGVDRAQLEVAAGYRTAPANSDDSPALAALIAILRRRWDELQEPEQRAINAVVRTLAGDALHSRKNALLLAWTRNTGGSVSSASPLATSAAGL